MDNDKLVRCNTVLPAPLAAAATTAAHAAGLSRSGLIRQLLATYLDETEK
jgi:hypothetical protein